MTEKADADPDTGDRESTPSAPVSDVLRRWQEFGGFWRVISRRPDAVTVSLCRCDGGEEIDRLTSADPELLDFLGGRSTSNDDR